MAEGMSCVERMQLLLHQGRDLSSAAAEVTAAHPIACGGCVTASSLALARPCAEAELSAEPSGAICGDLAKSLLVPLLGTLDALPNAHASVRETHPIACACNTAALDACDALAGDATCRQREAMLMADLGASISFADARRKIAADAPIECRACALASALELDVNVIDSPPRARATPDTAAHARSGAPSGTPSGSADATAIPPAADAPPTRSADARPEAASPPTPTPSPTKATPAAAASATDGIASPPSKGRVLWGSHSHSPHTHAPHTHTPHTHALSALLHATEGQASTPAPPTCDLEMVISGITCGERLHWLEQVRKGVGPLNATALAGEMPEACRACLTTAAPASTRSCARADVTHVVALKATCADLAVTAIMRAPSTRLDNAFAAVRAEWPALCGCDDAVLDACDALAGGASCRMREAWLSVEFAAGLYDHRAARAKVASEFPIECGPCAEASGVVPASPPPLASSPPPQPPAALVVAVAPSSVAPSPAAPSPEEGGCSLQAMANGATCAERMVWLLLKGGAANLTIASAAVGAEYPTACGACSAEGALPWPARPCEDVAHVLVDGLTCGTRIERIIHQQEQMDLPSSSLHAARAEVALRWPAQCGCTVGAPVGACDASAAGYTCRAREVWLAKTFPGWYDHSTARQRVAAEFPAECTACSAASGLRALPAQAAATASCVLERPVPHGDRAGGFTCAEHILATAHSRVMNASAAASHVAQMLPNACGACATLETFHSAHWQRRRCDVTDVADAGGADCLKRVQEAIDNQPEGVSHAAALTAARVEVMLEWPFACGCEHHEVTACDADAGDGRTCREHELELLREVTAIDGRAARALIAAEFPSACGACASAAGLEASVSSTTLTALPSPSMSTGSSTPLVSVLILTCNRNSYARLAVQLIGTQTYENLEIVLVDDGAEPLGPTFAGEHPNLPMTIVRSGGAAGTATIGAKRNMAVNAARGEYLIHWDDDDMYAPDRVARQIVPLISGEAAMSVLKNSFAAAVSTDHVNYYHSSKDSMMLASLAYTRGAFDAARGFQNISLGEDLAFVDSALLACRRLVVVREHDLPWPSMASHGLPWPSLAFSGLLWPSMASHGLPWPSLAFSGLLWPSMASHSLPRPSMAFHGLPQPFTSLRPSMPSHALPCPPMPTHALPCPSMASHALPCHPTCLPCHPTCPPMVVHDLP